MNLKKYYNINKNGYIYYNININDLKAGIQKYQNIKTIKKNLYICIFRKVFNLKFIVTLYNVIYNI